MKLQGDDETRISGKMIGAMIAVTAFVGLIIIIVLVQNKKPVHQPAPQTTDDTAQVTTPVLPEEDIKTGTGSPSDLDFWDKYPEGGNGQDKDPAAGTDEKQNGKEEKKDPAEDDKEKKEDDPSTDGKHTLVKYRDGSEKWELINPYLQKNDYDYSNLVLKEDYMEYYIDGRKTSSVGIDVNEHDTYIDFNRVKKAGIEFVMIRAGVRGYDTGAIKIDEYFLDNLKRANDAGLHVGIYFTSQAITEEEAVEEATTILLAIEGSKVEYPIAIKMGFADNDTSRIEGLTRAERTPIVKAFLDTVSAAGYTGMIEGDKEWLIKEIDMTRLSSYDVWLEQEQDLPDYPYKYSMWNYKNRASVDGVPGFASLNVSFIDYTEK